MEKFIIYGWLPGYNQLTTGHWATRNSMKQKATEIVILFIKQYRINPIEGRAKVVIRCYEPNLKRDPSNVRSGSEKIILDALQKCGIIKNDNQRWLEDFPAKVEVDRDNPRIEVEIWQA